MLWNQGALVLEQRTSSFVIGVQVGYPAQWYNERNSRLGSCAVGSRGSPPIVHNQHTSHKPWNLASPVLSFSPLAGEDRNSGKSNCARKSCLPSPYTYSWWHLLFHLSPLMLVGRIRKGPAVSLWLEASHFTQTYLVVLLPMEIVELWSVFFKLHWRLDRLFCPFLGPMFKLTSRVNV